MVVRVGRLIFLRLFLIMWRSVVYRCVTLCVTPGRFVIVVSCDGRGSLSRLVVLLRVLRIFSIVRRGGRRLLVGRVVGRFLARVGVMLILTYELLVLSGLRLLISAMVTLVLGYLRFCDFVGLLLLMRGWWLCLGCGRLLGLSSILIIRGRRRVVLRFLCSRG